jgi:hypothetical protein
MVDAASCGLSSTGWRVTRSGAQRRSDRAELDLGFENSSLISEPVLHLASPTVPVLCLSAPSDRAPEAPPVRRRFIRRKARGRGAPRHRPAIATRWGTERHWYSGKRDRALRGISLVIPERNVSQSREHGLDDFCLRKHRCFFCRVFTAPAVASSYESRISWRESVSSCASMSCFV